MEKLISVLCNERFILVAIMLNTVVMFLGGFWQGELWSELADASFTMLFLFEAAAKVSRNGWRAYWRNGWNRFDFVVLMIALPSLATPFIDQVEAGNTILSLRALRLFKSFRVLHFVPNIGKLLNGIKMACRASVLVFVAFVVFLAVFSILSFSIFAGVAPEFFGNPGLSLYSVFRLFTVEGWYEIPDAIATNGGALWGVFARVYFSLLMFMGGIIGMSLVNSIFVDAMAGDNNDEVLSRLKGIEDQIRRLTKERNPGEDD
ncbi:MAG: ion transporter [Muribaculaceae bacterium]|nr:ion transporter [Muribaculaceae bacterium]